MIFDRYRSKSKPTTLKPEDEKKKSSLANSFFRRFPIYLASSKKKNTQKLTKNDGIVQPRPSLSMPNMRASALMAASNNSRLNKETTGNTKRPNTNKKSRPSSSKRHSAIEQHCRRPPHLSGEDNISRHSFTFGRSPTAPPNNHKLTMNELELDPKQRAKLEKFSSQPDNTSELLAKLDATSNQHVVPHRSVSHQLLTLSPKPTLTLKPLNNIVLNKSKSSIVSSSPAHPLFRAHSQSHIKSVQIEADPLRPQELAKLLKEDEENVTLIDVRNLLEFQKNRIRGSLNVNLPSLLIKRYQRGTVSNFNLENFITTSDGKELYKNKRAHQEQRQQQQQQQPQQKLKSGMSILEQKAVEAEARMKKKNSNKAPVWVVYDEDMSEEDTSSQAWTLLNVLKRFFVQQNSNEGGVVYYLSGGFNAFTFDEWFEYSSDEYDDDDTLSSTTTSTASTLTPPATTANKTNSAGAIKVQNRPRRSISYTMGESDLPQRTSLFSLDTKAARINNANALARRAERRTQLQQQHQETVKTAFNIDIQSTPTLNTSSKPSLIANSLYSNNTTPPPTKLTADFPTSNHFDHQQHHVLNRVIEDDEILTGALSPSSEDCDFDYTISEIIPGFLYVGPEIESNIVMGQLQQKQIKRVLNMAEECQDKKLDKSKVVYYKISAQDTMDMSNIELIMMEAVQFIVDSKKQHEPVYVHCKAGKSRSVTAILAYLVICENWTLKRAYRHVIKARPVMSPNIGFISELVRMDSKVHGRASSFLETNDWQSASLPSPEYKKEMFLLESSWKDAIQ